MSTDAESAEHTYRVVDALYRLHRDMFELENVVAKTSRIQIRLAQMTANGRMGAMVAGMLVLVPILISLGNVTWKSGPAIAIYAIVLGLIAIWGWQVRSAGELVNSLEALQRDSNLVDLEDREDFVFEEINASVVRHGLIALITSRLQRQIAGSQNDDEKKFAAERLERYSEIAADCLANVQDLAETSARLVTEKKRTAEDHVALLDWCKGIRGFVVPP
jgi:hypothetical protein